MGNDLLRPPQVHPGFPQGHPMHNHTHDPQKVDDTGQPVVLGKAWSECSTGLFLNVLVTPNAPARIDLQFKGDNIYLVDANLWLHISSTLGKPSSSMACVGACLEIPSDLGQDTLKQQYVTEWVIATIRESVTLSGGDPLKLASSRQHMVDAVEKALVDQGL